MRDTRFKVMQAHQDFDHNRHQIFWQGLGQIRGVLTPDQQRIFDRDFTQPWEHHGHGHHAFGDHDHGPSEEGMPPRAAPQPPSPAPN